MIEHGATARSRFVILLNPASGKGRAAGVADAVAHALRGRGASVELLDVRDSPALTRGAQDAVLVVGGDGTLHHSLGTILAADAPVRVAPCGTENLFAREFGWTAAPDLVAADALSGAERRIDVARRDGVPFAVMCSAGPDASIVSRVAAARTGAIRHLSYVRPIIAETLAPTLPRMRVEVDGELVVDDARGWLVVANSRQYAVRIDPAPRARVDDGMLDVVFMPAAGGVGALAWAARSRLRRHTRRSSLVVRTGVDVKIHAIDGAAPVQCDGEAAPPIVPGVPARIVIDAGALRVLSAVV